MTVGDLARYMHALADIIGAAKGAGKDIEAAAKALAPFANRKMEEFATFLQLAEQKYGETGELPDGKQPKSGLASRSTEPKPPKLTVAEFVTRIGTLKADLARGADIGREQVTAEVNRFAGLTQKELDGIMLNDLKFPKAVKKKDLALAAIVDHIMANRAAELRSQP